MRFPREHYFSDFMIYPVMVNMSGLDPYVVLGSYNFVTPIITTPKYQ